MALAEGENAVMTLVLSSNNATVNCSEIEDRLAAIITPLGFRVQIIWADRGTPGAEFCETLSSAYRSPWTWMLLAALVTLKIMAGWKGFFWTIFWGTAAWFVSKVIISALARR